jgi:hypothetical protein
MKSLQRIFITALFLITAGTLMAQQPTATVNVKPIPVATVTNGSQTICNGGTTANMVLGTSNGVTGTTFAWSRTVTAGDAGDFSTSQAASGTGVAIGGNIPGDVLNNTGDADITVTYTITPTGPSFLSGTATTSCAGNSITATVVVKPTPTIVPSGIASIPGGTFTLPYTSASSGSIYKNITVPAGLTTTATTGALTTTGGTIAGFSVGSSTLAGTYNVVVTVDNGTCQEDITFPVVVNPTIVPTNINGIAGQASNETPYTTTGVAAGDKYRIDFTALSNGAIFATANQDFINANKSNNQFDASGTSQWVTLPSLNGSTPIAINVPANAKAGVYTVDIWDMKTVSGTDYTSEKSTFTITVKPSATLTGGPLCEGTSGTVNIALTGAGPWDVTFSDNVTKTYNSSPATYTYTPGSGADLTITKVIENGVTGIGTGTVEVNDKPAVTIMNNAGDLCEGSALDIDVKLTTGNYGSTGWQYQYSEKTGGVTTNKGLVPVSTNQTIKIPGNVGTQTTEYLITKVIDANGCSVSW